MTVWVKEDKTATGISKVSASTSENNACYNVLGQRIDNNDTTQGIKIMNGKKYLTIR